MNRRRFLSFLSSAPVGLPLALIFAPKTLTVAEALQRQVDVLTTFGIDGGGDEKTIEEMIWRGIGSVRLTQGSSSLAEIVKQAHAKAVTRAVTVDGDLP